MSHFSALTAFCHCHGPASVLYIHAHRQRGHVDARRLWHLSHWRLHAGQSFQPSYHIFRIILFVSLLFHGLYKFCVPICAFSPPNTCYFPFFIPMNDRTHIFSRSPNLSSLKTSILACTSFSRSFHSSSWPKVSSASHESLLILLQALPILALSRPRSSLRAYAFRRSTTPSATSSLSRPSTSSWWPTSSSTFSSSGTPTTCATWEGSRGSSSPPPTGAQGGEISGEKELPTAIMKWSSTSSTKA